jgi:type II secretory pathway component GspD/PulD (secretin)
MDVLSIVCVRRPEGRNFTLMRIGPGFKSHVRGRVRATLVALALCALISPSVWAAKRPCVPAQPGEKVPVDFRDVSLETVGRYVSCAASVGLVYSPSELRSRTVSVLAPNPVPVSDLLRVFEAALRGHGLVLEARGAFHVIREDAQPPSKSRSTRGR